MNSQVPKQTTSDQLSNLRKEAAKALSNGEYYDYMDVLRKIIIIIAKIRQPETSHLNDKVSFTFIPSGAKYTIELLNEARKINPKAKKFLDAGCGIGNILLIAKSMGFCEDYTGIEKFRIELNTGIKFIGGNKKDLRIIKDDILKFKRYHEYDVIYSYTPFADSSLQRKVLIKTIKDMKVGAIIIPVGYSREFIRNIKCIKQHADNVWVKGEVQWIE